MVGSWNQYRSDGDTFNIDSDHSEKMISTEVFDEKLSVWRDPVEEDNIDNPAIAGDYLYYGIMFPKQWCKMY